MATAINISSQFNAFVDFANKAIAGTVGTRGEDTVARIGAKGLGGRTITFATDDKVASMWRWQSSKDANDSVRDLFQRAVIEVFGGEDKIPDSVLDAMKLDDFGQGKPLTARRIIAVRNAINAAAVSSLAEKARNGNLTAAELAEFQAKSVVNKFIRDSAMLPNKAIGENLKKVLLAAVANDIDDSRVPDGRGGINTIYANDIIYAKMSAVMTMLKTANFDFARHLSDKVHFNNTIFMMFNSNNKVDQGRLTQKLAEFNEVAFQLNADKFDFAIPDGASVVGFVKTRMCNDERIDIQNEAFGRLEEHFNAHPDAYPDGIRGDKRAENAYRELCMVLVGGPAREAAINHIYDGGAQTVSIEDVCGKAAAMIEDVRREAGGDKELLSILLKDAKNLFVAGDNSVRSIASVRAKSIDPLKANLAELRELDKTSPGAYKAGVFCIVNGNSCKPFKPGMLGKFAAMTADMPFAEIAGLPADATSVDIAKLVLKFDMAVRKHLTNAELDNMGQEDYSAMADFCLNVGFAKMDAGAREKFLAVLFSPAGKQAASALTALSSPAVMSELADDYGSARDIPVVKANSSLQFFNVGGAVLARKHGRSAEEIEQFHDREPMTLDEIPKEIVDAVFDGCPKGVGGYQEISGNQNAPVSTDLVAGGSSEAVGIIRNLAANAPGVPPDATPAQKMEHCALKTNDIATTDLKFTIPNLIAKNLVNKNDDGLKSEAFDQEHYQFKRDLQQGGIGITMLGVGKISNNYNTARDQLVEFITDGEVKSFASASTSVKRQVGILMSFLTQYMSTTAKDSFSEAIAPEGGDRPFMVGGSPRKLAFTLLKQPSGDIKLVLEEEDPIKMIMFQLPEDTKNVTCDEAKSGVKYAMKVTIRKADLEKLAQADWSKYDREGISAAYKQSGGKNLDVIPEEYRFKVNAKVSFRFNLEA